MDQHPRVNAWTDACNLEARATGLSSSILSPFLTFRLSVEQRSPKVESSRWIGFCCLLFCPLSSKNFNQRKGYIKVEWIKGVPVIQAFSSVILYCSESHNSRNVTVIFQSVSSVRVVTSLSYILKGKPVQEAIWYLHVSQQKSFSAVIENPALQKMGKILSDLWPLFSSRP